MRACPPASIALLLLASACDGPPPSRADEVACLAVAHEERPGLYAAETNAAGQHLEVRIAPMDEPEVWLDEEQLTDDDLLQFDPALDDDGHVAWAQVGLVNLASEVVLDGEVIVSDGAFHRWLRLGGGVLAWVRFNPRTLENAVCRRLLENAETACEVLPFFPQELVLFDGTLVLAGFDETTTRRRLEIRSAASLALRHAESLAPTDLLWRGTHGPRLVRVDGDSGARSVFHAYRELFGAQRGEPFARGNDHLGRLAWNVAYRLRGLQALYGVTGDLALLDEVRSIAASLLGHMDDEGLFTSTKYSVDARTPIALAVNNASIHEALLATHELLTPEQASRALGAARAMFDHYEADWHGHYTFTPCSAFEWDGIVMPFNQQNQLGLVALQLHHLTGEPRYLQRVEALFDNHVAELFDRDGVRLWNYWPQRFYDGWAAGETASCNTPEAPPTSPKRAEDFSHARINLAFLAAAAHALGRPVPVDIEAIGENLAPAQGRFARFIDGTTDRYPASYTYLPPLPEAAAIAPWYEGAVDVARPDFDRQVVFLGHAVAAARSSSTLPWRLELGERRWEAGAFGSWRTRRIAERDGWLAIRGLYCE